MSASITPRELQTAVQNGYKRLENFRKARLLFLRQYAGQYYDRSHGDIGTEPLNMIFNAIRVLVPNIVMNYPKSEVSADFTPYRQYAEMLEMALDKQSEDSEIRDTYRRWLTDAIFLVGIVKTGLCSSGGVVCFDDDDEIDPGSVYTEVVDFDDFVMDASANEFGKSTFLGNSVNVSRSQLLESGLYDEEMVEALPRVDDSGSRNERADGFSKRNVSADEQGVLNDDVSVVELYIPRANAIVTVPREDIRLERYLRVTEYVGPNEGPYTFLSLTQPLPNNPIPVSSVGIWYDLHIMANRMATKIMTQADRQKTVLAYRRSAADDAQEIVDSKDGEAIAVDEPDGVKTISYGGQERSNEAHMQQLEIWFNRMSGNTEAMGGIGSDANTATQAQILQNNGMVGLEDMRDSLYVAAALERRKVMWYMHTDPLIEVPLIKRVQVPAKRGQFGGVSRLIEPGRIEHRQIMLTPEARRGDFLDYHIKIKMESMSRMDPALKRQATMEFLVKGLPAAVQAAQIAAMMGVPMSFPKLLIKIAKDVFGIDWFDEVFYDPEFQEQIAAVMAATPGPQGSQGTETNMMAGIQQNGQPGNIPKTRTSGQQQNRDFQMPAAQSQSDMGNNQTY